MSTSIHTEICEWLRHIRSPYAGEAARLIESHAGRIAELEAKCALLSASLAQEEARSAELEAQLANAIENVTDLEARIVEVQRALRYGKDAQLKTPQK